MKAPKCKLCGEEHWSPVCPKFARSKPAAALKVAADQKAAKPQKAKKKAKR